MVEAIGRRGGAVDVPDIHSVAVRDSSIGISYREISSVRIRDSTSRAVVSGVRIRTEKGFSASTGSQRSIERIIVRSVGRIGKRAVLGKIGNDIVRAEIRSRRGERSRCGNVAI